MPYQTQEEIHAKGFALGNSASTDYKRIKLGLKYLDDAILDLGSLRKANRTYGDKAAILNALARRDHETIREMSNYFFEMSGIYERICRYYAFLYRYDWFCTPYVNDDSVSNEKIVSQFSKVLTYLDQSSIKQVCGDIALRVIIDGCYYGYLLDFGDYFAFQQLPIHYCRSRFKIGNLPAVEFNMAFFDERFPNIEYRLKILDMFPDEFKKAYILYKKKNGTYEVRNYCCKGNSGNF